MLREDAKFMMKVVFGLPGQNAEKSIGKIIKLNPKTAKVELLEERGRFKSHKVGTVFVVPYSLMEPFKGSKEDVVIAPKDDVSIEIGITTFHANYADSNPLWKVIQKRGRDCWLCEIQPDPFTLPNGIVLQGDYQGVQKVFMTSEIVRNVNFANFLDSLHKQDEQFFQSLKIGQIVHYRHSNDAWVRTTVVVENGENVLKPVALVGNWASYDLPRRFPNGSIHYGYHADQIIHQKTFSPNLSHLWEGTYTRRPTDADPNTLPVVNLELPPMTPEQQQQAQLYQLLERVSSMANEAMKNQKDYEEALEQIKTLASR